MKAEPKHIPYLDGWRGIAIIGVFFGHFASDGRFSWVGTFGVHFFFVLSGYLMCNILFVRGTTLPNFFIRRFIRVFPTFALFVLALTLYTSFVQIPRYVPPFTELLSTLLFLRTYYPENIFNHDYPIGHLWSLNVEEHSYIFLALIAAIGHKIQQKWLIAVALITATFITLVLSQQYFTLQPQWPTPSDVRTEAAALGILGSVTICYIRNWRPSLFAKMPWFASLVAIALASTCFYLYRYRGLQLTAAPLFMAFAVNFLDRTPSFFRHALSSRVLRWLGTCSFSLYLWQQPFHIALRDHHLGHWAALAAAIGVGLSSFYAFEDPVRTILTEAYNRYSMRSKLALPSVDQQAAPKIDQEIGAEVLTKEESETLSLPDHPASA